MKELSKYACGASADDASAVAAAAAEHGASADGNVARIAHRQCGHAPTVLFA